MIVTIIGARPQFIKAAVVSKALRNFQIEEKIIHTGQHYDERMSGVFFKELGIPPYELNLNIGSGTHGVQTAQMLVKIEEYLLRNSERIKAVLLYGDTNSTMAGALAAGKLGIKIIHVESGLRSFNRSMPEEINRITTDHLSDFLFCPSDHSVHQLRTEGIVTHVYDVGDVMYDALIQFRDIASKYESDLIAGLKKPFVLLTIHRPANTDNLDNLRQIFSALEYSSYAIVWPIHPRTQKVLRENAVTVPSNVRVVEPFSYFEMLRALEKCDKVLTDSGGLQKEAYWMKRPCVTLRTESEWVETLRNDWNILVGADKTKIGKALDAKIPTDSWIPLYGDGAASTRIAELIKKLLYQV
jgi:UDP-GlcNAc3NAcA epimerase